MSIVEWLLGVIVILLILVLALAVYNQYRLRTEKKLIKPIGTIVKVNGKDFHVYAEGKRSSKPTLLIMAGSGVPAPSLEYKVLYTKLSGRFRVAVPEKAGYGYSEITNNSRDVETLVNETRTALQLAGETPPYVLLPHSYSGIEALYWSQKYPQEISAIVGLDMAVPEACLSIKWKIPKFELKLFDIMRQIGLFRIPFMKISKYTELSKEEEKQYYFIAYDKAFNRNIYTEVVEVIGSARKVNEANMPQVPMLLFVTEGHGTGVDWRTMQHRLAEKVIHSEVIDLSCEHKLHYHVSPLIAEKTSELIEKITN